MLLVIIIQINKKIKKLKLIITEAEKQAQVDSFQCHLHTLTMLPINKNIYKKKKSK